MLAAAATHFCPRCGTRRGGQGTCERDGVPLAQITERSLLGTDVGNYVLVQALGEGGMGAVYRAVHPAIGAEVAIKVLHATTGALAERFLLEAQAVNRVRHGNLIKIIDTGYLADRRPYLVMELLDGVSLADVVGKLAPELACFIAAEALDALQAVHDTGVVHRDLKPANIFLGRDGRVVVLDFGIAKLVDDRSTTSSGLLGTPEYMAPEQIRSQPVDRRTDVYAIGVLLYETIVGRRPFAAAATFDMLVQHLERPPTTPRDYVPNLSPAIADAIMRALEKDPARRFASAAEMASALRAECGPCDREMVAAQVAPRADTPRAPIKPPPGLEPAPAAVDTPSPREHAPTKVERPVPATVDESRPIAPPRGGRRYAAIAVGGAIALGAGIVGFVATREEAVTPRPIVEQQAVDAPPPPVVDAETAAVVTSPDAAAATATDKASGHTTTPKKPTQPTQTTRPPAPPDAAAPIDAPPAGSGSSRRKDNPFSTP